jgi:hypothetical protein
MIAAGRFIIFKAALADWEASGETIVERSNTL